MSMKRLLLNTLLGALALGLASVSAAEATCFLKQSTAVDLKIGPFLDSTDGNTVEGALTITQPDVRLSKAGGAFAQKSAAQTLTHDENGWYGVNLSATDTGTLGSLIIAAHESGALPVWKECTVLTAVTYDALIGTGTSFNANGAIKIQDDGTAVERLAVKKGTTSYIATLRISDQRTGGPLTGVAFNAAGLTCYYTRPDQGNAGATVITLATATRGAYTSGGWVEKDATNAKGRIELGVPNSALDFGAAPWVTIECSGAANMKPATLVIELYDNTVADALITASGTYRKNVAGQRKHPIFVWSAGTQAGLTGATLNITVSKDAAAPGAVTGTVAEAGGGWYWYTPSQADVNCDACAYAVTATGGIPGGFWIFTIP